MKMMAQGVLEFILCICKLFDLTIWEIIFLLRIFILLELFNEAVQKFEVYIQLRLYPLLRLLHFAPLTTALKATLKNLDQNTVFYK